MQISSLHKSNPKEFQFENPYDDKETGLFITVHALNSKIGKEATHAMHLSVLELRQDEKNLTKDKELKPELAEIETVKWIAAITETWRGVEDDKGKKIAPNHSNFIKVYTAYDEIKNAVYAFASQPEKFSKKQEKDL